MFGVVFVGCGGVEFGGVHEEGVASVQRCEIVEVAVEFFSFLATLAVRVFFAAHYDGVCGDENGQDTGQDGLHGDENYAGDGLGCLSDAEFLDEDENAYDGEGSDDLDEDVDHVSGASLVWSVPDEETEH